MVDSSNMGDFCIMVKFETWVSFWIMVDFWFMGDFSIMGEGGQANKQTDTQTDTSKPWLGLA